MRKTLEMMIKNNNQSEFLYSSDIDQFLIEQGTKKGADSGKLKSFCEMEEHPGWYGLIFEGRTIFCTIESGISLGVFVERDDNRVELSPELTKQLQENDLTVNKNTPAHSRRF